MKKVKSGNDISFNFNVKVTDKTTVDEIIREASDIIKVRFAEYKVEPEESEDERIIKTLQEYVKNRNWRLNGPSQNEVLAWLEKQKELDKMIVVSPEVWDNAISDAFENGKKEGEKQKEQKPAEKQDYTGLTDLERAIHRGFLSAGVENVPVTIIKETAQECLEQMKPAEWSEEDELMRTVVIQTLETFGGRGTTGMQIAWLKSLRPQHHKEIYQAVKRDLAIRFMNYLDENRPEGKMCLSNGECEDINKAFEKDDWVTIMKYVAKYQPHWKPSKEQINYLCAAVIEAQRRHNESVNGFPRYCVLKELYEQLLKL